MGKKAEEASVLLSASVVKNGFGIHDRNYENLYLGEDWTLGTSTKRR
jgi:hypothetical protein